MCKIVDVEESKIKSKGKKSKHCEILEELIRMNSLLEILVREATKEKNLFGNWVYQDRPAGNGGIR